jgi:hypothetical protein
MRILYYFLFGAFGLLGLWFVMTSLLGHFSLASGAPQWYAKSFLMVGAAIGAGLLYWAYRLGEVQQHWGKGTGAVLCAVLAFQMVQVAGAAGYSIARKF